MTTKKLHITALSDTEFIIEKMERYSHAFRLLYKMVDESADKAFMERFKERFMLNDIEYRSIVAEVKSFKKREQTEKENKIERIAELEELISSEGTPKRKRIKFLKKLARLRKSLTREATFGGLELMRSITRECNKADKDLDKISELKDRFHRKRVIPFHVVGEANQKGNRFFDLSKLVSDGTVVYKPCKGKKVEIKVKINKNWRNDLETLSKLSSENSIPVSVALSTDGICLTYDEERLKGFSVDEASRRAEVANIKSLKLPKEVESERIKEKYREYYDAQRQRKLQGKIRGRCLAIDMNPTNIGYSVLHRRGDSYKVIEAGVIDLSGICEKSGKESSSEESKYLTNKRIHEVPEAVKRLFSIARHHKCSSFVMEGLEMKNDDEGNTFSTEANRKVKNIWNRELVTRCITRRCNENGIELVEVKPCYSSFIGNIQHPYSDPANASVEIGRRGLFKYTKGGFYPDITAEDMHTLEAKFGDVAACGTGCGWVETYKSLRKSVKDPDFSHRLRAGLHNCKKSYATLSMSSYKSGIKVYLFN